MNIWWLLGQLFSNGGVFVLSVISILLIVRGDRRLAVQVALSVLTTFIVVHILKYLVPVDRPFISSGVEVPFSFVSSNDSFPSGHSAVAFAIAVGIWLAKHKLGSVMLVVALFVAIGRVLLLVHYPTDVIVGAMIGSFIALVWAELLKTRKRRLRKR